MEDSSTPSPDYVTGFNEGYTLSQYMPDISDKLGNALADTDRGHGFRDGKAQFTFEQEKAKYPSWLQSDRLTSTHNDDREQDKDKEKD